MKKNHNVLFFIIAVALIIGGSVWYYFYWEGNTYFTTDNAKVTAKLHTLTSPVAGKLVRLNCELGDYVVSGDILARVDNGPHVKSPVDGFVVKSDVVLNQIVAPTTAIAVVADINRMYVGANIEETDIMKIREGQSVDVRLDAYPGKVFKGSVKVVDSATQSALTGNMSSYTTSGTYTKVTQLIPIEITLEEDVGLENMLGTNATVKIKIR